MKGGVVCVVGVMWNWVDVGVLWSHAGGKIMFLLVLGACWMW